MPIQPKTPEALAAEMLARVERSQRTIANEVLEEIKRAKLNGPAPEMILYRDAAGVWQEFTLKETTGTNPRRHCMLSLGAVNFETGQSFYGECSIYKYTEIDPKAMEINGMDIAEHQPGKKQPPHMLYENFWFWAEGTNLLAGHNVGHFDILFLEECHTRTSFPVPFPFSHRTVDLHSIGYAVFRESLKLSQLCDKLGVPQESKPHNALKGAMAAAECFWALEVVRNAALLTLEQDRNPSQIVIPHWLSALDLKGKTS